MEHPHPITSRDDAAAIVKPVGRTRVIVLTDLAASAASVARQATLVAGAIGASVELRHYHSAIDDARPFPGVGDVSFGPFASPIADAVRARLTALAEQFRDDNLRVEASVWEGAVNEVLQQLNSTDIVVCGLQRRPRVTDYLCRPLLQRLLEARQSSVLVVPAVATPASITGVVCFTAAQDPQPVAFGNQLASAFGVPIDSRDIAPLPRLSFAELREALDANARHGAPWTALVVAELPVREDSWVDAGRLVGVLRRRLAPTLFLAPVTCDR